MRPFYVARAKEEQEKDGGLGLYRFGDCYIDMKPFMICFGPSLVFTLGQGQSSRMCIIDTPVVYLHTRAVFGETTQMLC